MNDDAAESRIQLRPLPCGTQVVTLRDVPGPNPGTQLPRGAVGVIVQSARDLQHSYRIRFPDGVQVSLRPCELTTLNGCQQSTIGKTTLSERGHGLFNRVILQCVVGSQAYGLADQDSDIDRRGCYLPPAEQQWSLSGVPENIECHETQELYWEIRKFIVLALKANPNVLECLYSPIVEEASPLAEELLAMRQSFLSRLVHQTYSGYVMSQFKKLTADVRNHDKVKWKHVMHLIRLLICGIGVLREGVVHLRVEEHRERLLNIRRGDVSWEETERWRLTLHDQFDAALSTTVLPARPDYASANAFLIKARHAALSGNLP